MDRQFPGVLAEQIPIRRALRGSPFPDVTEEQVVGRSLRHQRELRDYFTHRPGKLLAVNWAEGDGWRELCGLLGHPVPDLAFPHVSEGVFTQKTAEARGIQRIRTRLARFFGLHTDRKLLRNLFQPVTATRAAPALTKNPWVFRTRSRDRCPAPNADHVLGELVTSPCGPPAPDFDPDSG